MQPGFPDHVPTVSCVLRHCLNSDEHVTIAGWRDRRTPAVGERDIIR